MASDGDRRDQHQQADAARAARRVSRRSSSLSSRPARKSASSAVVGARRPPPRCRRSGSLPSSRKARRSPTRRASARSWVTTTEVTPMSRLDRVDERADGRRGHRVEAGGGLVEEHHLGLEGQRAGQGDALLHAAREVGRASSPRCPARPTMASFSRTRSADARPRRASACSRSGKATLSKTFIESKSAPLWNSMAIRRRTGSSSRSSSVRRARLPSKVDAAGVGLLEAVELAQRHALAACPSGRGSPGTRRAATSKSRPSSTDACRRSCLDQAADRRSSGVGARCALACAHAEQVEQLGQEEVGDQDQDRGEHHGVGGGAADAVGAARGGEAIVAADDGDEVARRRTTCRRRCRRPRG